MGCNSTKSTEEKVYFVAPEADPANTTSPDIVYKPEQVSLDGRANDELQNEVMTFKKQVLVSNQCNDVGKSTTNSTTLSGVTQQYYLMPNSVNVNNGYATHRSTHLTSAPEQVQPLFDTETMHHVQYTSRLTNQPASLGNGIMNSNNNINCVDYMNASNNNTGRRTQVFTEESIPVTEHIIVNFQSTNNNNNNQPIKINNGYKTTLDRISENSRGNNADLFDGNAIETLPAHAQPVIEVCDVISTFHGDPNNEYCDSDIVVIPTPQTAVKSRS